MEIDAYLDQIRDSSQQRFDERRLIKSFQEFLRDLLADPYPYLRTAPRYCVDMFDFFGSEKRLRQRALRVHIYQQNVLFFGGKNTGQMKYSTRLKASAFTVGGADNSRSFGHVFSPDGVTPFPAMASPLLTKWHESIENCVP